MDARRGPGPKGPATAYTGAGEDDTGVADLADLMPGQIVGEYRVEGTLGEGGMGKVYSAVHPVIAKRAAIKVLHPQTSMDADAVQRFIQEARSVNQIGHPNIVDIFSFGVLPDGRQYFVMELLRGESLRDRVKREGLSITEALSFVATITLPLEAAHDQGIVHRDLKPDNVFLVEVKGDRPTVKLLDFGIAKLLGPADGMTQTGTGKMLGTPAYISPEQARGEHVDHRTDIYALGAMLFELVTGEMVFVASNVADLIAKQLFEPPRLPSSLNPSIHTELDQLIVAMLAKSADERPTLEQIRHSLRGCREQPLQTPAFGTVVPSQQVSQPPASHTVDRPSSPLQTLDSPKRRPRRALIGIVAIACMGGGAIAVVKLGGSNTVEPAKPVDNHVIEAKPDPEIKVATPAPIVPDPGSDGSATAAPIAEPTMVSKPTKKRPASVKTKPAEPGAKPPDARTGSAKKRPRDRDAPM